MKVTALLPDPLIQKVRRYTKGRNLTDCLVIALKDWVALKKIVELNHQIEEKPLQFVSGFHAESLRILNRRR